MRRLVWLFGWTGVAVWSLVCLAVYGVLKLVGGLLMSNADAFAADPEIVEWIWRVLSVLYSLSSGAVLVGWAVVSLLILAVPWFFDRVIGSAGPMQVRASIDRGAFPGARPFGRPGSFGQPGPSASSGADIDLAPDQYSVKSADAPAPRPAGPVPRIDPRR